MKLPFKISHNFWYAAIREPVVKTLKIIYSLILSPEREYKRMGRTRRGNVM